MASLSKKALTTPDRELTYDKTHGQIVDLDGMPGSVSSSQSNCASSSGSMPALDLYLGHMSLRKDSMT